MRTNRNTTLNILKAIACFHVVLIHCIFPEPVGTGFKSAGRFAVPLFFCISGYYFAPQQELKDSSSLKKLRHILWLIIGSELFYIAFAVFFYGLWNPENRAALYSSYFTNGWMEKYIILGQSPVYAHLWFLYALAAIYALALFVMNTRKRIHIAYLTIPISILSIIFLQEFKSLNLLRNGFQFPGGQAMLYRSSFFFYRALPFFLTGSLLREMNNRGFFRSSPLKLKILPFLILVSQIAAIVEGYVFPVAQFYLGSILAALLMMIYSIIKPDLRCGFLNYIGDELSIYVYILHIAVMKLWDQFTARLHLAGNVVIKWTRPLMTILLSLFLAYLVNMLLKKVKHSRLAKRSGNTSGYPLP